MLCKANVNLSEWPEGEIRDVDPKKERTVGLLRGGYIVPMILAPAQPSRVAPSPLEAPVVILPGGVVLDQEPTVAPAPETTAKSTERPVRARQRKPAAQAPESRE